MGMPRRLRFDKGEKIRITNGVFNGMEAVVAETVVLPARVKVELAIFGRAVTVELEPGDVEPMK